MMYVKSSFAEKQRGKQGKGNPESMGVPMISYASELSEKGKPREGKLHQKAKSITGLSKISSGKVMLFSIIFGAAGLLYLNHVYAVQKHHKEVLMLQREHEKARRLYSDRKFTYDRMIGPAEVYERAKVLGLQDGGPADGIIYMED